MNWRIFRIGAVFVAVALGLLALVLSPHPFAHKLVVRAYFTNAMNLRAGAPVRLAGVEIGSVKSVRARPEAKESPAEVVMVLTPGYELKIPSDSTVSVATAGVFGETYVSIDSSHAFGAPIVPNGVLKTTPSAELSTLDILNKLDDITARFNCEPKSRDDDQNSAKKLSQNSRRQ